MPAWIITWKKKADGTKDESTKTCNAFNDFGFEGVAADKEHQRLLDAGFIVEIIRQKTSDMVASEGSALVR